MSDFVKLKDLCATITDGSHYSPPASSKGYPMLSSKDMNDTDFDYSHCKYIDEKEFQKMKHNGCVPLKDDVLIIKDGNNYLEKVFVVKETKEIAILSSIGILRPNTEIVDPYYIKYYLTSRFVKEEVAKKYVTGSALPRIILKNFGDIDMPYVNLNTQHRIVRVLKEFDDAIDNNNIISSELESLAKTIYDYWFLQFDFPDENGRPYKSSGGKMVWNEELKREIPEKWAVKKLSDIVRWEGGAQPPKSTFVYCEQPGYVRFIQNRDYADNSHKTYIRKSNNNKLCNEYDIMMDKYGDAGAIRFGIAGAYNVALAKIDVQLKNGQEYVRSFLKSEAVYNYLHQACVASTRASLNGDNLSSVYIPIPSQQILFEFEKIIKKDISQILLLKSENQQLSSLRDFLLPMLMNGQVTFKEDA